MKKKDEGSGKIVELDEYRKKRDFQKTPEPQGGAPAGGRVFVIHKHAASHLHYDLRLEIDGVLKSWAVPKGPSLDPQVKRLAMHVEDHPYGYKDFEGVIPEGQYGGGTVMVWDEGVFIPEGDPALAYEKGSMKFRLEGQKLQGMWALVRLKGGRYAQEGKDSWLFIKEKDSYARPGSGDSILREMPLSAATGRSMEEIAAGEPKKKSRRPTRPE